MKASGGSLLLDRSRGQLTSPQVLGYQLRPAGEEEEERGDHCREQPAEGSQVKERSSERGHEVREKEGQSQGPTTVMSEGWSESGKGWGPQAEDSYCWPQTAAQVLQELERDGPS